MKKQSNNLTKVTESQLKFIADLMEVKGIEKLKVKIEFSAQASVCIKKLQELPDVVKVNKATEKQIEALNNLFAQLMVLNPVEPKDYSKLSTKEASELLKEYIELINTSQVKFF